MTTYQDVLARYEITIPFDLIADAEVPVLSGPQRQGDVGIFPRGKLGKAEQRGLLVPPEGVAVVRGETATGRNTHWLSCDGPVYWAEAQASDASVLLGVLDIPEGSTAFLIHEEEHGCNAMAPGVYTLHGKREQADIIRRVAD